MVTFLSRRLSTRPLSASLPYPWLIFVLPFCVHVFVYACTCVWRSECMCVNMCEGQRSMSDVFVNQSFQWTWRLLTWLDCLASKSLGTHWMHVCHMPASMPHLSKKTWSRLKKLRVPKEEKFKPWEQFLSNGDKRKCVAQLGLLWGFAKS